MPGPGMGLFKALATILREPVFRGLLPALYRDCFVIKRDESLEDESIASFFARRLNPKVADNGLSAFLHGIYAGDIEKLSVRSILPPLWNAEGRFGSVIAGVQDSMKNTRYSVHDWALLKGLRELPALGSELAKATQSSVFTLRGGLGKLAHSLEASLVQNRAVQIEKQTIVKRLHLDEYADNQVCSNPHFLCSARNTLFIDARTR